MPERQKVTRIRKARNNRDQFRRETEIEKEPRTNTEDRQDVSKPEAN